MKKQINLYFGKPNGEQIFSTVYFFGVKCSINGDCALFRGLVKLSYKYISVLFLPSAVAGTHVTTVSNAQFIQQQPVMQGGQNPQYQPVPTQPGYGGQPMQTGPYQAQPYAPGPPPPYQVTRKT